MIPTQTPGDLFVAAGVLYPITRVGGDATRRRVCRVKKKKCIVLRNAKQRSRYIIVVTAMRFPVECDLCTWLHERSNEAFFPKPAYGCIGFKRVNSNGHKHGVTYI